MKERTFYVYTYSEFDALIKRHFGRDFEFLSNHEACNGVCYHFSVRPDWFKLSDWKDVLRWSQTGEGMCMAQQLLELLAYAGAMLPGDYLVTVFW